MTSLGRKIISAFLEVDEKGAAPAGAREAGPGEGALGAGPGEGVLGAGPGEVVRGVGPGEGARRAGPSVGAGTAMNTGVAGDRADGRADGAGGRADRVDSRFAGHFDKLLSEANIPGPDYYEFARMIAVMQAIPDEAARYNAAFAGLQLQGLNKQRLLETAGEYLRVLVTDAEQFQATVDASYQEKVCSKEADAEEKAGRIRALSQEIMQLQQQISALQEEIRGSKEKLAGGSRAYSAESTRRQQEIRRGIEKIGQYIH
ncbi:MAG TPA: hypothetical protein VL978_14225 [Puia sp.]|nr:hypothetical protein [Puia sp.]